MTNTISAICRRELRYEPNLHDYTVKVIIAKVSAYGDNLDRDVYFEVLK